MSVSPPLLRRALRAANYRRPSMAVIAARSIVLTLGAFLVLLVVMSALDGAARGQVSAHPTRITRAVKGTTSVGTLAPN